MRVSSSDIWSAKYVSELNPNSIANILSNFSLNIFSNLSVQWPLEKYNGILIPAHVFTPHKSFYGHCTDRLENIFKEKFDKIFAIEFIISILSKTPIVIFLLSQVSHFVTGAFPSIVFSHNSQYVLWYFPSFGLSP